MKRSQRLAPVQRYNQEREDQAARRLREIAAKVDKQRAQIEQLQAFRMEYAGQANVVGRQGVPLHRIRAIQDFVARLDQLIEEQRATLARLESDLEGARLAWQAEHRRRRAVDALVARHQSAERRQEHRREQKEQDEGAARRRR